MCRESQSHYRGVNHLRRVRNTSESGLAVWEKPLSQAQRCGKPHGQPQRWVCEQPQGQTPFKDHTSEYIVLTLIGFLSLSGGVRQKKPHEEKI
jgi:hypothetical protein